MLFSQTFKNKPKASELKKLELLVKNSAFALQKEIINKLVAPIDIVFNQQDIKIFEKIAKEAKNYCQVLVLGVGGSSLGGKTICSLVDQSKIQFLESIDPNTIKKSLAKIDYKNTFFLVISKSGETIETICQTLIIVDEIKQKKIKNFAQQFLFVSQSENNPLTKIAKKIGARIINHPSNIGGRFSCFSVVGMLPAMIAGIDAKKVREGAKIVVAEFLKKPQAIIEACSIQIHLYERGFESSVVMPYIDVLKDFTDWYRQIWAESLGKKGFGSTPINSMGTVDQHSQLQLYLDGPKNKFFTFITQNKHPQDYKIKDLEDCKTLFGGKKISEIVAVEVATTIEVLNKKKLPIRIFNCDSINEEVLGGLMMQMFIETILIAKIKNINPFDQPAVELRKDLARKIFART